MRIANDNCRVDYHLERTWAGDHESFFKHSIYDMAGSPQGENRGQNVPHNTPLCNLPEGGLCVFLAALRSFSHWETIKDFIGFGLFFVGGMAAYSFFAAAFGG